MNSDLPTSEELSKALDLKGLISYACRAYKRTRAIRAIENSESSIAVEDAVLTAVLFAEGRISRKEFVRRVLDLCKPIEQATQDSYFKKLSFDVAAVGEAFVTAARTHIRSGNQSVAEACMQISRLSVAGLETTQATEQVAACRSDLEKIKSYPRDVFVLEHLGPLWPGKEPEWAKIENCQETELAIEISVPDDVSDAEVIETLKTISIQIDDFHRALGGHGLMVQEIQIYEDAGVVQGVSDG